MVEEELSLSHLSEIKGYIKQMQSNFSEYSFANLYLFRQQHNYKILRYDGFTFVHGKTYDGVNYLMPLDNLETIGIDRLKNLMSTGFSLYPIAKEDLHFFDEGLFSYNYNPDDSDYMYTREKIRTYPGRKLHKKRNLVKQYRTLYSYRDLWYDCIMFDDAKYILEQWLITNGLPEEETDYQATHEAIKYCHVFGLSGQIYYANKRPSGFLIGEELNSNTYVIHFAKGITNSSGATSDATLKDYKGIYPHMYNSLAEAIGDKYAYINFEQDLGKESLKQAKSTYLQDMMLDKFRVKLIS